MITETYCCDGYAAAKKHNLIKHFPTDRKDKSISGYTPFIDGQKATMRIDYCPFCGTDVNANIVETSDTEKALNYYKTAAMQSGNGPCPKPLYIPKTVRLSDWPFRSIFAGPGDYEAKVNPFGAVSIDADGELLGLRLSEFEVVEWTENPHADYQVKGLDF